MKQPLRNYCLQNWHISHATSLCRDCWFFCPGCIHYVNMNQSLYLLFNYLCQGTASLEDCYFVSVGHNKHWCFLSKRWLNSIFLRISKLNSLALLINNFIMLKDVFNDLHLVRNKLKRWYVFLFKFSNFGKIK